MIHGYLPGLMPAIASYQSAVFARSCQRGRAPTPGDVHVFDSRGRLPGLTP